jgi:hypothetical protein
MKKNPLSTFSGARQFAFIIIVAILATLGITPRANAFSLIGPYAYWMNPRSGYQLGGDIGGPMSLNEEYRWDVPIITYGFDKSFVDYFGTNGVAAVESAIQILNDLPTASNIVLSNFLPDTRHLNFQAAALNVYDLKSAALALLIEQLGLGQPTRNVFDLQGPLPPPPFPICTNEVCPGAVPFAYSFISRNFDPETLIESTAVNGTAYSSFFITNGAMIDRVEFPMDPLAHPYSAVADAFSYWYSGLQSGTFYSGLTSDDAGGLRYLLNATNMNWESLPKDVLFAGKQQHANNRLRGALRPGVEKITFVRQPQDRRGKFKTAVFKYTAGYVTNGVITGQLVKRVVSQPDILFSADGAVQGDPLSPTFFRTGTEKWTKNAGENGDPTAAGPGVINPSVNITLGGICQYVASGGFYNPAVVVNHGWASFDQSTNPPVLYPENMGQTNLLVRLHFFDTTSNPYTEITNSSFPIPVPYGASATLQISTNAPDWVSLATVTNTGAVVRWDYFGAQIPISFRVVPGTQ